MGRALPFLIVLVATLVALIDCLSSERAEIRGLPRPVWILAILLLPIVGPVAWFFAGRPVSLERAGVASGRAPKRPTAPDDDPDFLRGIDTTQSRNDAELLRRWEEDLKRRDDEK
ncbi:PLD nuclease N-terminal domain-containing protein [Dactylosporangium sp. AC04546]|uniref:PLD nuclease N-terminal domain-containing protein n=1 Tax=Dactylosporangium sp. AC04546 TaxID=2862460 RepID=UPI001EDF7D95|nr:PLD nuclease N-terminal domain-containing protein [Dactylosporangium sp. AC04546]WVK85139.1 PLD nuclease N-terminal domain-containing protein [Dactylosporangium sp. AC04546]